MSHASSSPDPLSLAATSPIRSSHRRSTKGPLAPRSANYHTSPVKSMILEPKDAQGSPWRLKVTIQAEPTNKTSIVPLNDSEDMSQTRRRGTPRNSTKQPVSARLRSSRAGQPTPSRQRQVADDIPELCPVSQLGEHGSTDYSLSEIDFPAQSSHAEEYSLSQDITSKTPLSARSRYGAEQQQRNIHAPVMEEDEEPEAVLGAYAPGDATVLESEEFSMISVDSLTSRMTGHSSPSQPANTTERHTAVEQSFMPSSPPAFVTDRTTPVPSDTPHQDPQAPPPMHLAEANVSTPLRESARKSGRALQDALNGPFRVSFSNETPSARDSVFAGFSSGTRRQLRQSLQAGQGLAPQPQFNPAIQSAPHLAPSGPSHTNYLSPFHSPVRQNIQVQHQPDRLLTPETDGQFQSRSASRSSSQRQGTVDYPSLSDRVQPSRSNTPAQGYNATSWAATTSTTQGASAAQMQSPPRSSPPSEKDEAITQNEASVADDAEAEADDGDRDIWQEEASRSLADDEDSPEPTDLFLESLPVKPRRSKLPGTWRHTSGADFSYTDSPEPKDHHNRKVSASTVESSRKSSGVMTPPSSGDEHGDSKDKPIEIDDEESEDEEIERVNTPHSQISEQDSTTSGDDTGLFWQANLPAVFAKSRRGQDIVEKSFVSSPLRNTILDISPMKHAQDMTQIRSSSNPTSSVISSPLRRSLLKSSKLHGNETTKTLHGAEPETSETQTDSSMASDVRQLHREMKQHTSTGTSTVDLTIETPSEHADSVLTSQVDLSRSYQEELNLYSPTRIKVNFNDSSGNSSLLEPRRAYPPLFDNVPALPKPTASSPESAEPRSPNVLSRLTESFWEAVTAPPAYAPSPAKPAVVVEPIAAAPTSVPDHVLRLRRKYGMLPDMHPFTYAHIRTLHRMLNSSRSRPEASIVPRSGLLGHGLSKLLGKTKTNELDQRFMFTAAHLHVVDAFMSLLLPVRELSRLESETGKWGDSEAIRHRGKDSKGRRAEDVVFKGVAGGKMEAEWVADVLADICFKEEMNAKKKKVAEMMARAEKWERMER